MMHIRIVWMRMGERFVPMHVRMRLPSVPRKIVRVLMMCVVNVTMAVFHRFVDVHVFVMFREV